MCAADVADVYVCWCSRVLLMLVLLVIGVPLNATHAVSLSPSHAPCLVGSPKGATCMTCNMGLIEEKETADVVVVSWWCPTAAS